MFPDCAWTTLIAKPLATHGPVRDAFRYRAKRDFFAHNQKKFLANDGDDENLEKESDDGPVRDAFRYRAKRDFFRHNQKKFLGKWSAENLKALEELVKKQATEKYATYPLRGKAKAAAEAAEKAKEVDEDEDEDEDEDDEMEDESQPEEVPWQVVGREPQSPGGTRKEAGNREVVSIFYILPSISNANYIASSATYPLRGKAKAAAEAAEKAKEVDEDEDEDEDEDDEMEDESDDETEGRRPAANQGWSPQWPQTIMLLGDWRMMDQQCAVAIDGMTDTINSLSQETPSLPWLHMRSFVGPRSMSWKTFEAGLEFEIARISVSSVEHVTEVLSDWGNRHIVEAEAFDLKYEEDLPLVIGIPRTVMPNFPRPLRLYCTFDVSQSPNLYVLSDFRKYPSLLPNTSHQQQT
ncbi:hypothetical protein HYFRA_00008912 [Hymenoscyphus fraxineus]|uniref:Uncharacterized protein n=1 Tax=Hymenoscyphus fraxineus TaxID=746836 RepID=A0A9N9PR17_9HELO|nr:hypothetical protein HYFRA_00008912 [Hymenoscyphus fraxineus]